MPAAAIDYREQRPGAIRIKRVAGCQAQAIGCLQRVRSVVTLTVIVGVVAQEIDALMALEIGNAQDLSVLDHATPGTTGIDGFVVGQGSPARLALCNEGRWY